MIKVEYSERSTTVHSPGSRAAEQMQEHSSHALIQSASHTAGQGGLQPGGPTRTAESGDRECSQNQRWQPLRVVVPSHSLIQSSLHLRGCNAAQGACFLVVNVPPLHLLWYTCGGLRTTCGSCFSPSAMESSGLAGRPFLLCTSCSVARGGTGGLRSWMRQ